jgi:hypothetical protein
MLLFVFTLGIINFVIFKVKLIKKIIVIMKNFSTGFNHRLNQFFIKGFTIF